MALSALAAAASPVESVTAEPAVESAYVYRVWRLDDGLPPLTGSTLIEAPEGYLWMEAKEGLVRFDGNQAKTFSFAEMQWPKGATIDFAIPDAVQGLWVTLKDRSLWRERGGQWTRWGALPEREIPTLLQPISCAEGGIFLGSDLGRIFRCDESGPGLHEVAGRLPKFWRWLGNRGADGWVWYVADGLAYRWREGRSELAPLAKSDAAKPYYFSWPDGTMWAIGKSYVAQWRDGAFHRLAPLTALGEENIAGILPVPPHGVWASTKSRLFFLPQGAPEWRGPFPWATRDEQKARTNLADSDGNHWIATYGEGFIFVTPDGRRETERLPPELAGNRILNLIEDRERNIWAVAEGSGLVRLRPRRFKVHHPGAGRSDPEVLAVAEDPAGAILAGSRAGGVDVLSGGTWRHARVPPNDEPWTGMSAHLQLPDGRELLGTVGAGVRQKNGGAWEPMGPSVEWVRSLLHERDGTLWLGAITGLFRWDARMELWQPVAEPAPWPAVRAMTIDAAGRFWLATANGAWVRGADGVFGPAPASEGLPQVDTQAILAEPDGTVWFGLESGLARWRAGRTIVYTAAQGLPVSRVLGILAPGKDQLWLSSTDGLGVVERAELEKVGDTGRIRGRLFTRADGLPTREASGGFQQSLLAARDGRCWMPTHQGLVEFDPRTIPPPTPPPPVVIEDAAAYGDSVHALAIPPLRSAAPGPGPAIPVGLRRAEFRFTAPSLSGQEKVLFRWRLEGLDAGWSAAVTQRTAAYPYVPPGKYRFRVIACNGDGVWNETGASIPFIVPPHWHERPIFWAGLAIVLCGLAIASLRVRYLRRIERLRLLSALDHERARIAQDIHDDLGATLTQISMWSAVVQKRADPAIAGQLGRIRERSNEAVRSLDQIVWAVNPVNDTVRKFATYLCQAVADFFKETGLACRIDLAEMVEDGVLHADVRHHLVLAAREACTNALRHAAATEVSLHVDARPDSIDIVIADNGKGFDVDAPIRDGEGLTGMKRRLASTGGHCVIESAAGKGTKVVIRWQKSP